MLLPVIRVTPPKTAAAPTIAYKPGVMQSSWPGNPQLLSKNHKCGYLAANCCMKIPTIRPVIPPMAKLGMNNPQGTCVVLILI